jgi:hypothetical protein
VADSPDPIEDLRTWLHDHGLEPDKIDAHRLWGDPRFPDRQEWRLSTSILVDAKRRLLVGEGRGMAAAAEDLG